MSEFVERVARAICKAQNTGGQCERAGREIGRCDLCISGASAAISAMREPTEAMIEAAIYCEGDNRLMWNRMIDAALADPKAGG